MKKIYTIIILIQLCLTTNAQSITIGERISLESKIYHDRREVIIYKPPTYYANKNAKFPVLYMVDADYNFHYVSGMIELLSSVSNSIPEMIIVGISGKGTQTYRKNSKPPYDVNDKGNADVTIEYIKKELMPYIDKNYKTNSYKILSGHSIGGLFVTYAMLHHAELFNGFIAISPSLWWENESLTTQAKKLFEKKPQLNTNFYISLADEQGMGVHGFLEMMQVYGPRSLNLNFKYFPNESHGSVGMPTYKWALNDIFEMFKVEDKYFKDATHVKEYHDQLKKTYKTSFHIGTGFLRNTLYNYAKDIATLLAIEKAMADYFPSQVDEYRNLVITRLISTEKLNKALAMLMRAKTNNPEYFETHANYAAYYLAKNNKKKAIKSNNKALSFAKQQQARQWQINEILEQAEKINSL